MTALLAAGPASLLQSATVALTALLLVLTGLGKSQLEWRPRPPASRSRRLRRRARSLRPHGRPRSG